MPVYTVETPSGHRLKIESDSEAGALQAADEWHAQNSAPPDAPVSASGLAKAAGTGLVRGAEGLVGLPGDVKSLMTSAAEKLNPGANEARAALDNTLFGRLGKATQPPTSQQVIDAETKVTGGLHEPQNRAERFAQAGTEFVPAALAGPGGMARKAVMQGVVPGLASEAAGQALEGTPLETAGRIGAAVMAPGVAGKLTAGKELVPTLAQLQQSGATGFNAFRDSGIVVKPGVLDNYVPSVTARLNADGLAPELASKTHSALSRFESQFNGRQVSTKDIDVMDKVLGRIARETSDFKPTEDAVAALRAKKLLDSRLASIGDTQVVGGDFRAALNARDVGKADYAASQRLRAVERANEHAGIDTASKNSGFNFDNTARQKFKTFLKDQSKVQGFSDPEKGQIARIVNGSFLQNNLRSASNMLGGGGGFGRAGAVGLGLGLGTSMDGSEGGAAGAIGLPVLGALLRRGANRMTKTQINKLTTMVAQNSPLSRRMYPKIVSTPDSLVQKGIRAILASSP